MRCIVLVKGVFWGIVVLPSLGAMAACTTSLSDATPAAGTTFTVGSGECAANINIAPGNDGVTIDFLSGAEPFQAGKSIVLPTSGVVVGLKVRFTGVNWGAVRQKIFSGGHATWLELKGLNVEFIGSSITSTVSDPIGFSAKLTTSSRYTISSSTISVSGSGGCLGLRFWTPFTDSTLSITNGSVQATSSNSYAYGILFDEAVKSSTLEMTHGSVVQATGYVYSAYAIWFPAAFTNSTLVAKHGSALTATSTKGGATTISFDGAFSTESTVCVTDDSVLKATGGQGRSSTLVYPSTIENQCSSGGWTNGVSSLTAAALGLVTMVLSAF